MLRSLLTLFLFTLLASSTAIAAGGSGTGPDLSKLKPSCFSASANPVLKSGDLFSGATWNDPSVLKVGAQYVMYASADVNFDQNIQIYRLVSADGKSWSLSPSHPVFSKPSNPNAWDAKSVETPSVVLFKNVYYLFYTGYPSSYNDVGSYKIGYATSVDGINWVRRSSFLLAPTLPKGQPNLNFNQYLVGEPGAVVFNGKIYLYFSALGADANLGAVVQTIGLVTSSNGTSWSAPQRVLVPDQAQYPISQWAGYSTPSPIVLGGKLHLYFSVAHGNPWNQQYIHHAVSSDGISNWAQDSSAVFNDKQFAWSYDEIRAPTLLLDGTQLLMWLGGTAGTTLSVGLANCAL